MRTGRTVTHWGTYEVDSAGGEIVGVRPFAKDPDPSPIGASIPAVTQSRVMAPSIRKSWLEGGPGSKTDLRGIDPFVEVDWETALDLAAAELGRVRSEFGNEAIFGGSYGWSSSGRFHHAQSQLHRFLTVIGGYTYSKDTYSHAAGSVITPHIVGHGFSWLQARFTSMPVIAEHTELMLSFGGIPMKNAQVQNGGMGRHTLRGALDRAKDNGTRFVNVSPVKDDVMDEVEATWLAARPGSDVAVILGLIHTLIINDLTDENFLSTHCEGWATLRAHILGKADGIVRSADWAAEISELNADSLRELAIDLASSRSMINIAWSLQRADHGEQTWWAAIALAAALGQIGLLGGGFGIGYGAVHSMGNGVNRRPFPAFRRPPNQVETFIPVSRIADLLLNPGDTFTYNGSDYTYPHIELVYWAGGNPFHHHQDLNRLVTAWQQPATIIVNEPFWTSTAKRADIVFPATTPLERTDVGGSPNEDFLFAMDKMIDPVGQSRNDYDILSGLADRMALGDEFTERRTADQWVRHMYESYRSAHDDAPSFEKFVDGEYLQHPEDPSSLKVLFDAFRADPIEHALPTPSGKIELYSATIAGFAYDDCPPHPTFLEPHEWLGNVDRYPLHMISNQPTTRLHSQLDHGEYSTDRKIGGREVLRMHPGDAAARSLSDGDAIRIWNDRGVCFAGLEVTDRLRPGVVELPTGAWFDPADPSTPGSPCRHGNPNILTRDVGSSSLGQGPVAQSCLVEIELAVDPPTPAPFQSPVIVAR